MALPLGALMDEMAVVIGSGMASDDDLRVSFKRWLNQAFRKIAYAFPWDGLRVEQRITTVAPYTTGTVTLTLGSTTVTGSGTTFTAAMEGRKIALSAGSPPYRISTYVSATSLTLADAYAETTATASAYTLFQDEYDLAATTHSIEQVVPMVRGWLPLEEFSQRTMDGYDITGYSTGQPRAYGVATSTTANVPRLRIVPVPDAVYRLSIRYLKTWADLSGENDLFTTQGLPNDIEELALDRALRWAPKIEGSRRVMTDLQWADALRETWKAHRRTRYPTGQRRGIGGVSGAHGLIVSTSGLS